MISQRLKSKLYKLFIFNRHGMASSCKNCFSQSMMDFVVSDEEWNKITSRKFRNEVLCLACFDNFAFQKSFKYEILEIHFAGNQNPFSLHSLQMEEVNK